MRNKNGRLYLQIYAISYIWLYGGSASSLENQVSKLNYYTLYGLNYACVKIINACMLNCSCYHIYLIKHSISCSKVELKWNRNF